MATCGFRNLDGSPCRNRVSAGSFRCAARHPVTTRGRAVPPMACVGAPTSGGLALDVILGSSSAPPEAAIAGLKAVLDSDDAYAVLDSLPEVSGSTWTAGACLVLARALVEVMPEGRICTLVNGSGSPEHYCVRLPDGRFLDGDGVSSLGQLLCRWREQELVRDVCVVDGELPAGTIPSTPSATAAIGAFLRERWFSSEEP